MDLDELQSVQSRERQTDSLQQLRASFYRDAAEYIHDLEDQREQAAERADDPWNSPEVGRLNDDIDTAEQTVEAIYERRVGKIVKMASLAAAEMPTEDEGLTAEEQSLFDTLVTAIEENRDHVFAILDGDEPVNSPSDLTDSPVSTAEPSPAADQNTQEPPEQTAGSTEPEADSSSVRELPGDPPELAAEGDQAPPSTGPDTTGENRADDTESPPDTETHVDAADLMAGGDSGQNATSDTDDSTAERSDGDVTAHPPESPLEGAENAAAVDRATVRITADVGEILGVDQRAYDLTADDVVTLPEANAGPLVERDAAERLE